MTVPHRQAETILAVVRSKLGAAVRSIEPTITASAMQSVHKGDKKFFDAVEQLLQTCATHFNPDDLIAQACRELWPDEQDPEPEPGEPVSIDWGAP